jgi:rhamnosyltransferase
MVSVIIPTFNGGAWIGTLLAALKKQTVPLEVIVIDSSSTDDTVKIVKSSGARLLTVKKSDFNHGRTRNVAVQAAEGDVLVFLTQDALPVDERAMENLVYPLEAPHVAACYGRHIPRDDAKPTEKFARHYNYPEKPLLKGPEDVAEYGIRTFFFSNVFSAVKRSEFMEVGCFPEDLIMFEDMMLSAKLIGKGYHIAYSPEARVIHSHNYSLARQFRRYMEAGISFGNYPWLSEAAHADREGLTFLKEELKFLVRGGNIRWVGYAMLDAAFKYVGYNLGLNVSRVPIFLSGKVLRSHV